MVLKHTGWQSGAGAKRVLGARDGEGGGEGESEMEGKDPPPPSPALATAQWRPTLKVHRQQPRAARGRRPPPHLSHGRQPAAGRVFEGGPSPPRHQTTRAPSRTAAPKQTSASRTSSIQTRYKGTLVQRSGSSCSQPSRPQQLDWQPTGLSVAAGCCSFTCDAFSNNYQDQPHSGRKN